MRGSTKPSARRAVVALLPGIRVLLVEDQTDTRELFAAILRDTGALVTEVASAGDAFTALERDRPEVIVSDLGLPGADGCFLLERIRALPADRGGRTPALALTAYARLEDRSRCLAAGFDAHLTKPVEPNELIAAVMRLIERPRGESPGRSIA